MTQHSKSDTHSKTEHKTEHKAEHKPEHKAEHKTEHKPEHKAEHKSEHKTEHKTEHKPEHKPEHKADDKSEHKTEHKAHGNGSHAQHPTPIEIQKALGGVDYPASRDSLVDTARHHHADDSIVELLGRLPSNRYETPADVSKDIARLR